MTTIELTSPICSPLSDADIQSSVRAMLHRNDVRCRLLKRSADCRRSPIYLYSVEVALPGENFDEFTLPPYRDVHDAEPVLVIGSGPAGMFASLRLLMEGFKPVVLERGKDVHARKRDVAALSRDGLLDPDSNYCFGEGGAGTFSDGKLFTRSSKRGDNREVLMQFVKFGARHEILTDSHPHIGSDKLPEVVENIRKCILEHGGEYHFGARVVSLKEENDGVEVICADGSRFAAKAAILATGHSARDVYEMLRSTGGELEAKGFALGVRAEHPQKLINDARYRGRFRPGMPAAEYSFVKQVDGRGVFSFCMCPGGILVPSSTEDGTVVLNGMSNSARNSQWANSGVVVEIRPEDCPAEYASDGPFSLLNFQRDVERRMYTYCRDLASHPFAAPAQRLADFCEGRLSKSLPATSYHPGAVSAPLHSLLPAMVADRLRKALPSTGIRGYYTNEALLLGVESRTSSPVRIPRNPDTLEYVSMKNVFPAGEGAGYAGGIVSSAIDGIRAALAAVKSRRG